MTIAEIPPEARAAMLARRRKEIDELDYRRELRRLEQRGYSQRDIARWLGIAQPSVLSALRTASKVTMPLDGFSGATPYEICQRYAAGFIDRAKLVDELTRFPYVKGGQTDGYDSLIVDPVGTWSEVSDAARRGLIEDDVYEEVFNRRHGIEPAAAQHADTRAATVDRARGAAAKNGGGVAYAVAKNGRQVSVHGKNIAASVHKKDGGVTDRSSTAGGA